MKFTFNVNYQVDFPKLGCTKTCHDNKHVQSVFIRELPITTTMSHVHEDEMYRRSEAEKDAINKFHNSHPTDAHTGSHQAELDKNLVHGMSSNTSPFFSLMLDNFLLQRKLVENSILLYNFFFRFVLANFFYR